MANEVPIKWPPLKVRYLVSPQFSGNQTDLKASSTWAVPLENTNQDSWRRSTGQTVWWTVKYTKGKSTDVIEVTFMDYPSASATSSSFDIIPHFGHTFFYPRGDAKIVGVVVGVSSENVAGKSEPANLGSSLYDPVAPTLGEPEFDADAGILSVPVECEQRTDRQPLYDVKWTRKVYDSSNERTATVTGTEGDGTGDIDFDVTYDAVSYQVLQENPNRFFKMTTEAFARGMHGDSGTVTKNVYISMPLRPVITSCNVSQGSYSDRVTVRFTTKTDRVNQHNLNQHPFTGCRIQYLKNVTETNAQTAYSMEGWEDYDIEDNGACTALYVPVSEVRPEVDKITWIRVKVWNRSEDALWYASVPYRLTSLETESPTAGDDPVFLAPLKIGNDGTSIWADLYWDYDGTDDATGTQVDWSTDGYAWASTVEPSTYNTLRDDGPADYDGEYVDFDGTSYVSSVGATYHFGSHTRLYIRDLEVGKRYWVKARRYLEGEESTTYGPWSIKRSIVVGKAPDSVTLSAPERISYGEPLPVSWAVGGSDETLPELGWRVDALFQYDGKGPVIAFAPTVFLAGGKNGTRATAPWSRVEGAWLRAFREQYGREPTDADHSKEVTLYLTVTLGVNDGESVVSQPVAVLIKRPPAVSLLSDGDPTNQKIIFTATEQPVTFTVRATEEMASLDVVVRSLGVESDLPDGRLMQESGHVMWSGRFVDLAHTSGASPYTHRYAVELPFMDGLVDNALYQLSVRGTAAVDGARSETDERDFNVKWGHPAAPPDDFTIVPTDYVDEAGNRHREATVTLASTGGEGDTYDLYRVTPDGATRVASGLSAGDSVTDPYAPFGELGGSYRLCTVTEDGAMAWRDEGYELNGTDMRIDFGNDYVELPYDVSMSDSFSKDFEARHHYGGGRPEGYWNEGVSRTSSLSTGLIRVKDADTVRRVRALAQYVGPCFVRLPNGCAYEADVQVNDMSETRMGGMGIDVSINATEISPTGAYEVGVS